MSGKRNGMSKDPGWNKLKSKLLLTRIEGQEDWWNCTSDCQKAEASMEVWATVLAKNLSLLTLLDEQSLGMPRCPLLVILEALPRKPHPLYQQRGH